MKYCENCGAKLDEDSLFCEECGTKIEDVASATSVKRAPKKVERKPLTKKQKTIGLSIFALILVLFLGYNVGTTVYSQENQTSKITEALASKDAEQIAGVVTSNDSNFEVNAENLAGFAEYLNQNPNYLSELIRGLETTGRFDSFYIQQNGKKFGLYDSYELVLTPVYGKIYTNEKDVVIFLGEEELFSSDSANFTREVGPFAPGVLTFKAEGSINGFPLTATEEIVWLSPDGYNEVDLSLYGTYFSVSSDLESATVFLNDESIGQLENGHGEFGPVQFQEDMELHVGQSFGEEEIVSEKVPLVEGNSYYEFHDLVMAKSDDVNDLLYDLYNTATKLSRNYKPEDVKDYNAYFHPDGTANEEYGKELLAQLATASNNEEINNISYRWEIGEVERVGVNAFEVAYEVTHTTKYSYRSGKDDGLRHYAVEALVRFEPTNHPDREFDSFIYEVKNKELLYEEGEGIVAKEGEDADAEDESVNADVSAVVTNFVNNLAPAINNDDFSLISSYLDPNSAFYETQASFVSDTHGRGITETLENVSVSEVTVSGDTAKVKTSESFTIHDNGEDRTSSYEAVYDLKKVDGNYLITGLTIN